MLHQFVGSNAAPKAPDAPCGRRSSHTLVARHLKEARRLRQRGWKKALGILAVSLLCGSVVRANPELISTYDSRAAALGGAGVAYQTNGAAAVHNVALLSGIKRLSATATFTPYAVSVDAPFTDAGRNVQQITSKWTLGPLGQLGVGVRVHKRVVVGLAAYLPFGLTSNYQNAPLYALSGYANRLRLTLTDQAAFGLANGDLKPVLLLGELSLPVAVEVFDWLSVGAAYRMSYANQSLRAVIGGTEALALSMTAKNFAGYDLGVWFHPQKLLSAGLSYRAQIDADYHADLTLVTPTGKKTTTLVSPLGNFSTPHLLKVGAAVRPLRDLLMVTGEYRYYFYEAANVATNLVQLQDAWTASLGVELQPTAFLALRAGGGVGSQATPRVSASPFSPPPGKAWIATVGAGLKLPTVDIDLAVGYGQEGTGTTSSSRATAGGTYVARAALASLSANFHL